MTDAPQCKEQSAGWDGWRSHPCRSKAKTPAGYCLLHDPEEIAKRRAKRGPTKYERECAAREEARQKKDASLRALDEIADALNRADDLPEGYRPSNLADLADRLRRVRRELAGQAPKEGACE